MFRETKAAIVPTVTSDWDPQNFDKFDEIVDNEPAPENGHTKIFLFSFFCLGLAPTRQRAQFHFSVLAEQFLDDLLFRRPNETTALSFDTFSDPNENP